MQLRTRQKLIRAFAEGGLQPFGPEDPEFMDQVQLAEAPPQAPAPPAAINTTGAPEWSPNFPTAETAPVLPAATPQAQGALRTAAQVPGSAQPQAELSDDEIKAELERGVQADTQALGTIRSHLGGDDFNLQRPARRSLADDEVIKRTLKAQTALDAMAHTLTPTDYSKGRAMIDKTRRERQTALQKDYADSHKEWLKNEREELKSKELTGDQLAKAADAVAGERDTIVSSLKRGVDTQGQPLTPLMATVGKVSALPKVIGDDQFDVAALRLAQLNGLPGNIAARTLMRLGAPVMSAAEQPFNERRGPAAANYKVVSRDVGGNATLQTRDGVYRLPVDQFRQLESGRVRAWYAARDELAKYKANEARPSLGARLWSQGKDLFQ